MMAKWLCFLLVIVWSSAASAEVYKWVDENGKVHFGDRAPEKKSAEEISAQLEKTNVDHGFKEEAASSFSSKEKTQDEKDLEAQKKAKLEETFGERCRQQKQDLAAIARGDPGRFIGADGQEEIVLEKDRGKKLEELKAVYRQSVCQQLYPLED